MVYSHNTAALRSPWLSEPSSFQIVHDACRAAVERAMTQLAQDTEAAVRAVRIRVAGDVTLIPDAGDAE